MVKATGEKLFQVFKKQADRVIYFSRIENISPNIAVHEIRKSFKRIRALLQLYKMQGDEYAFFAESQIVMFGKALSPIRNSCVNLSVLEKIAKDNSHIAESKFLFVKERLTEKNKEFIQNLSAENILGEQIRNFMHQFEADYPTKLIPFNKQQLIQQLSISYQKGFETYSEANVFESWKSLHDLRKELKVLNYQYKFLSGQNKYFKLKSRQLAFLSEILGDDHDLYVFLKELQRNKYNLESSEIEIIENQINHLHDLYLLKFQSRLKQFFAEPPLDFTERIRSFYDDSV